MWELWKAASTKIDHSPQLGDVAGLSSSFYIDEGLDFDYILPPTNGVNYRVEDINFSNITLMPSQGNVVIDGYKNVTIKSNFTMLPGSTLEIR